MGWATECKGEDGLRSGLHCWATRAGRGACIVAADAVQVLAAIALHRLRQHREAPSGTTKGPIARKTAVVSLIVTIEMHQRTRNAPGRRVAAREGRASSGCWASRRLLAAAAAAATEPQTRALTA